MPDLRKFKLLVLLFFVPDLKFIKGYRNTSPNSITCKDDTGKPVDWFIIYKLPLLSGSIMAYMDSCSMSWRRLGPHIDQDNQPIAYTLNQIYNRKDQIINSEPFMYAMYNDETPDGTVISRQGHTKGVVSFDMTTGFWLIHSVPKFPPPGNTKYSFPDTGKLYGQTFLCVSLNYKFLDDIGQLFLYNYPNFYSFYLPQQFNSSNHDLTSSLEGKHNDELPGFKVQLLTSTKGQTFTAFAKNGKFGDDLWSGLVSKHLKSSLVVESWRKGSENLPSFCSSNYKVENVLSLKLVNLHFNSTQDHSKWAVSRAKSWRRKVEEFVVTLDSMWTCIGDINRQKSQASRGGGTVCFDLPEVAKGFQGILVRLEECKRYHL